MRWISGDAMRTAERRAVETRGLSGYRLMCRAGAAVARAASYLSKFNHTQNIVLVAGSGNNGGDALVAARCLHEDGFRVTVLMICLPAVLKGNAHQAWSDLHAAHVPFRVLATTESWNDDVWMDPEVFPRGAVVVDGLLGTGARGEPRGVVADAIRWINAVRPRCKVCSIDLPSGMDADTGEAAGPVVKADSTITFSRPKKGFLNPAAQALLGHLEVADIGIPDDLIEPVEDAGEVELITLPELRRLLRPRPRDAHKGDFGHALLIGGCALYPHAPVMACMGALRAGAGLVTLAGSVASREALGAWLPEAIFQALPEVHGRYDSEALLALPFDRYTAVAVGPGLGQGPDVTALVRHLLDKTRVRLVLDADALTVLAELRNQGWTADPAGAQRLVITPHPGEAARLLGSTVEAVQADRTQAVRALADLYQAVAVLKGAGTLICEPGGRPWLAIAGNPGMATAGSGDVLTGIIAGLLAKGFGCLNAAQLGVWVHGTAGDTVAIERGQETMTAMMIADRIRL